MEIRGGRIRRILSFTGRNSLVLLCAHSIYLLYITPAIADILFEDDINKSAFLFVFKFAFVYIMYFILSQVKVIKKSTI